MGISELGVIALNESYEHLNSSDLRIVKRIQHLRCLMLIHNRIYYILNDQLISDKDYDTLAGELVQLQKTYPKLSEQVEWDKAFHDWNGHRGYALPLNDPWVVTRVNQVFKSDVEARIMPFKKWEPALCVGIC